MPSIQLVKQVRPSAPRHVERHPSDSRRFSPGDCGGGRRRRTGPMRRSAAMWVGMSSTREVSMTLAVASYMRSVISRARSACRPRRSPRRRVMMPPALMTMSGAGFLLRNRPRSIPGMVGHRHPGSSPTPFVHMRRSGRSGNRLPSQSWESSKSQNPDSDTPP